MTRRSGTVSWRPSRRRPAPRSEAGAPSRRGPSWWSCLEKFELIASGHGIALLPLSVARAYSRPGLAHVPVTDAPGAETCPAVLADRRDRLLHDCLEVAASALREA
ncbi:hypothetical protein [Streptomyces sp. NPDC000134]|uniref:hypothetical protein n=1 Tax=Streptomyces sp. NPDC000134 TaxID=3364536 RepID=UPI0036A65214